MIRLTGTLALLCSGALAFLLSHGLRRAVLSGEVFHVSAGKVWLFPDDATWERYGALSSRSLRQLEVEVTYSIKSDFAWYVLRLPGEPPPSGLLRIDHHEFTLPGTGWGVWRTALEREGRRRGGSAAAVYLAYAGASAAPLGLWSLGALIAGLASPRRKGILEPR